MEYSMNEEIETFDDFDEEIFKEPLRAKRRRIREQKIKKTITWLKFGRYWGNNEREPHRYMFLDPNDDDDMMFIWTLTDDDLKPFSGRRDEIVYYIEGYGVKNPPVPIFDHYRNSYYTPDLPLLTVEDVDKSFRNRAVKLYDTPKNCNCDSCKNPRHRRGKKNGTKQERIAREAFISAMDDLGYNPSSYVGTRISKTKNGW